MMFEDNKTRPVGYSVSPGTTEIASASYNTVCLLDIMFIFWSNWRSHLALVQLEN